ncbi:MAG: lysophospholipid acyltransferase family protein [Chloroflexota bacterium]
MTMTIFNTPIISSLLRLLTTLSLRLLGWRVEGRLPDIPKFIVIGAPHTSNWDFVLFLALAFSLRANPKYMGKAELFRWPFSGFFRWCGGIPVDRSKSTGLVEQTVEAMNQAKEFILVITPEGTRGKVRAWKSGFYHIAKQAGIPIALGFIDRPRKAVGIGPTVTLTEEMDADIRSIQSFYTGMVGINSRKTSELGSST